MRVTNPNDLKALSKGLEGMTGELEEEIKRLPPGVAMLVSNEIERPITVNVRPRKSRHGGVSTQIVIKDEAVAAPKRATRRNERASTLPPAVVEPRPIRKKKAGGLLEKVFGPRGA